VQVRVYRRRTPEITCLLSGAVGIICSPDGQEEGKQLIVEVEKHAASVSTSACIGCAVAGLH